MYLVGKFASIYYREILSDVCFSCIDYVILGDGEYTLSALMDCIENSEDISKFVATHKNIASRASMNNKDF